jgi:dTDP-4-dehydrorhamnose reductase
MSTETNSPQSLPECWGGVECTINRVNDNYRDQLYDAGHYFRKGDITQIGAIGFKRLRYPLLWELHEPSQGTAIDWSLTAGKLEEICACGMIPIAGLLHHGSGPRWTDLLDDFFPEKLAAYALKVARRFPWLEYYTPVNEPLTTARFSGLYGLWYPHGRDEHSFLKMLFNQVRGTVLAMEAIRTVNPAAKLVQTEDLGKTHSTGILQYQADFENERRWMSYDLLCGKLDNQHPLWAHCRRNGISDAQLRFFLQRPCIPEVMGFNYYVTSERFLDHRLQQYPGLQPGGNGRHEYIDTEAVHAGKMQGLGPLLREAWERYRVPLAVTECHLHCTREEQIRWLHENWETCCWLNKEGILVKGFTFWALMGAYDWDSLLVRRRYHYEGGCFELTTGKLKPTLLFNMARQLCSTGQFDHPLLANRGWWQKKSTNSLQQNTGAAALTYIGNNAGLYRWVQHICRSRNMPLAHAPFPGSITRTEKSWAVLYHLSADDEASGYSSGLSAIRTFCRSRDIPLIVIAASGGYQLEKRGTLVLERIRNQPNDPLRIDRGEQILLLRLPMSVGNEDFAENESQVQACLHKAFDLVMDGSFGIWEPSSKKHWHYVGAEEEVLEQAAG